LDYRYFHRYDPCFLFSKKSSYIIRFCYCRSHFFWLSNLFTDYQEDVKRKTVSILATFDTIKCSTDFPILIKFTNNNLKTLLSVSFNVGGYRNEYSAPAYSTATPYTSNRIINTGESYEARLNTPDLLYGQPAMAVESLSWRATYLYATFGRPH